MGIGPSRALLLFVVGALPACHYLEKYKTCRDVRVELVNSQQTIAAVSIAAPGEDFTPQTLLVSGASREVILCLDKGDVVKFRAAVNGQEVGVARCVTTQTSYEATSVSVIWTLQGFVCQGW